MDVEKARQLADKMNKITEAFKDKLDESDTNQVVNNASDLLVSSDDLVTETDNVITADLEHKSITDDDIADVINLQNMVEDVKFIRNTLRESTETSKKLLKSISTEIEIEPDARMLQGYAEISGTVTECMKIYLQCYKEMSNILLNLAKVKNNQPKTVTNINIEAEHKSISTVDLIRELSGDH